MYGCWSYDAFGNRTAEELVTGGNGAANGPGSPCRPQSGAAVQQNTWVNYNAANNRITASAQAPGVVGYDLSGNTQSDGLNNSWYDAEGQLCAVQRVTGDPITAYVYDAEGARIAKGTLSTAPALGALCAPLAPRARASH